MVLPVLANNQCMETRSDQTQMMWKPKGWVAIVIGIIFHPFAFLYVNRLRLFWVYFGISLLVVGADFYLRKPLPDGSWLSNAHPGWLLLLICPFHAYRITTNYDPAQPRSWYAHWWVIPVAYIAFLLPIFLFRAFLFEPFSIPSKSMSPTLNPGDHVIVRKWGFGTYSTYGIRVMNTALSDKSLIRRGKLYVFYPPNSPNPVVKRLIGLPGDVIEVDKERILVNGEVIPSKRLSGSHDEVVYREHYGQETYLIKRIPIMSYTVESRVEIPDDHYFLVGDNRDNSADSRMWGAVSASHFVGEVIHTF